MYKSQYSLFIYFIIASEQCKFVEGHKRKECGYYGITRDECLDKACCWSPIRGQKRSKHPWCHHSEGESNESVFFII